MIVCFRCTVETRNYLDRLLESGAYRDYGDAIATAVRNQVVMEEEAAETGTVVIGGDSALVPPAPAQLNGHAEGRAGAHNEENKDGKKKKEFKRARNDAPVKQPPLTVAAIPVIFQKKGFPEEQPAGLADLPADMWAPGQVVPLDRWVLGQHNRLLPAKANARALIRLFIDSPKGLVIDQTAERVAAEAAVLGDYLSALDDARKVARDEALATAFPTTAEGAEKGRSRYANQFVVYQNGRGELSGLMVDLKLVNVVLQRKERLIVPTRVAWELARMWNPVLDGDSGQIEKFSSEERGLLLRHIVSSVPVEAFAYRAILEAVRGGKNTPDKIDAALKSFVTEDRAEKLSQSFLASQRSGAVSRMSDLGLIERRREGVRVSYAATEQGEIFLTQCAAVKQ